LDADSKTFYAQNHYITIDDGMISLAVNSENLIPKLAAATLMCLLVLGQAHADVIAVCPSGCNYTSISEAIDAAEPGDVIEVQSGTYYENVNVTKQLTLLGVDTGGGRPVVDAGQKGSAITLSAEGVTVDGFVVTNSIRSYENLWSGIKVNSNNNIIINNTATINENGIWANNSDNNTIAENSLNESHYAGIRLESSKNNTIKNNNFIYNVYGIYLAGSADNSLNGNNLSGNNYAIHLLASDQNEITGNNASLNEFGINLTASTNNTLRNNSIFENEYNFAADGENDIDTSNLVDDRPIYYLVNASGEVVNSSSNASTIYCIDCDNITVMNLKLEKNIYGIRLQNATDSRIENVSLSNNLYGIEISKSHNITIINNTVKNNRDGGIGLKYSDASAVINNSIIDNSIGIKLEFSEEIEISDNNIRKNEEGISFKHTNTSTVKNNSIINNRIGIRLESSEEIKIMENNISNDDKGIYNESSTIINNSIGIKLESSEDIEISENNISSYDKGIYNELSSYIEENNIWIDNNKDQYTPDLVNVSGFEKFPGDADGSLEPDSGREDGDFVASSEPDLDKDRDEDKTTSKSSGSSRYPYSNPETTIPEEPIQIEPEQVRFQKAIDRALELLPKAQILFHPEERMTVGVPETVEVIITRETSKEKAKELAEKEMAGEGEVEIGEIPISYDFQATADLTGGYAFEIKPKENVKKGVPPPPGFAEWEWDVTPLVPGTHDLKLLVIATIRVESEERSYEFPVFKRDIVVEVSPGAEIMSFISNNWKWIITTVMIPVGGWYLSHRAKKKNLPPKNERERS